MKTDKNFKKDYLQEHLEAQRDSYIRSSSATIIFCLFSDEHIQNSTLARSGLLHLATFDSSHDENNYDMTEKLLI